MSDRVTSPPLSELARPGKRAVVAPDLSGFHGPTRGRVELPHRMFWQANPSYDGWLARRSAA